MKKLLNGTKLLLSTCQKFVRKNLNFYPYKTTTFQEAQNYRIWSSENPHAFVETRLHPTKVGVWIAAS
jgi:hypothetical protein